MTGSDELRIRNAVPGDEATLFELIRALARFARLDQSVTGTPEALASHLFGERPVAEALLAERGSRPIGFALFFTSYSTFRTRPGIYLEDLYVVEDERGAGVGKALLSAVIGRARDRNAGRVEWSVLDWNERAIRFYERMGAAVLPDSRICRVSL